jgi:hypothetical protein
VARDGRESYALEERAEALGFRRGVFDELESVRPHRIGGGHGDLYPKIVAAEELTAERWIRWRPVAPTKGCARFRRRRFALGSPCRVTKSPPLPHIIVTSL